VKYLILSQLLKALLSIYIKIDMFPCSSSVQRFTDWDWKRNSTF